MGRGGLQRGGGQRGHDLPGLTSATLASCACAGLVFGAGSPLINSHISALIPQMTGRPVQDLFKLSGGGHATEGGSSGAPLASPALPVKKVVSSMKRRGGGNPEPPPGSKVMELALRHLGDEAEDLLVSAQAFWKMGSTSQVWYECMI